MSWAVADRLYSRLEPLELPTLVAGSWTQTSAICKLYFVVGLLRLEQPVLDRDMIFGHATKAVVPGGALPSTE